MNRTQTLPGGYMGAVLRIDLTAGTVTTEELPSEDILRRYWGGQALALYYLLREQGPQVKPLDPESTIVMMTGPVTGTGWTPGGTKMTSVYLSPITGYTLGRGATSGFWGAEVKAAGYDGLIVTGQSPKPVYLLIDENGVELRDASSVWGLGTRRTEDELRKQVSPDARVACIGPAGENLIPAAMLVNDYNHNAAHGAGAVLGAKRLKAIVARGTRRPPIANKAKLMEAGDRWRAALQPLVYKKEYRYGVGYGRALGGINRHNWRASEITDENRGLNQNRVTQRPCFQCSRLCPWDAELGEGPYAGQVVHFNAGAEWLDTFFNLDVKGNAVLYLSERINDLGIECSHFADGAGVAFEAWEKGLLGPDRTDGLALEWGDAEVIDKLLEKCARREGWLGNLLADGPKELADALGGDAPNWVVHTKGGSPAQHEWRPHIGQMLREVVASGGMKPQGGGSETPPPDLEYREKWGPLDRDKPDGWALSHFVNEQFRQFSGLMGACWFAMAPMAPDGLNSMVDTLNATTGWDVSMDEAMEAGHRAVILQGIIGTQHGWKPEQDWTDVGPRFLEPVPDGKFKGFTVAPWLPDMVREYYQVSGRDAVSGRPFKETLEKLDLAEFGAWAAAV